MNGVGGARRSANRKSGLRTGGRAYDVGGVSYLFQFRRYRLPLRAPVRTAHGVWTEREGVIVRVENEARAVGHGEAAVIPWFGTETADEAEAACRELGGKIDAGRIAAVPAKLGCLRNALAAAVGEIRRAEADEERRRPGRGPDARLKSCERTQRRLEQQRLTRTRQRREHRRAELESGRVNILFCNGPQCPQTPEAIGTLLDAGHPAASLAYYRGGLHDWVTLGFPTEPV